MLWHAKYYCIDTKMPNHLPFSETLYHSKRALVMIIAIIERMDPSTHYIYPNSDVEVRTNTPFQPFMTIPPLGCTTMS